MPFYLTLIDKTKECMRKIDKNKLAYKYFPMVGSASYLLLSTEFTTPSLFSK